VVRVRSPNQWAHIIRRAAHPQHPQFKQRSRPVQRREVARYSRYAQRPNRPGSRQNICSNIPIAGGESSLLHRRAREANYRFVKSEITLEGNVTKAWVYERGDHRLNYNGGDIDLIVERIGRQSYHYFLLPQNILGLLARFLALTLRGCRSRKKRDDQQRNQRGG